MLEFIASLIFAAPLAATMIIALGMLSSHFQHETSERLVGRLSTLAVLISLFSVIGLLIFSLLKPDQLPASLELLNWFSSGQLSIKIALYLDFLAM